MCGNTTGLGRTAHSVRAWWGKGEQHQQYGGYHQYMCLVTIIHKRGRTFHWSPGVPVSCASVVRMLGRCWLENWSAVMSAKHVCTHSR